MMKPVLVLSVAVLYLSTSTEASKCDTKVLEMIKERHWNHGHCIPRDILGWAEFLGPWVTMRASTIQEKVTCVYTVTEGNTVKLYKQKSDNATLQGPKVNTNVEEDGLLIEQESGNYGVHLYINNFGIKAIYKCSPNGEVGAPEGVIKASPVYKTTALEQAVKDLEYLGIKMSDQVFDASCLQTC